MAAEQRVRTGKLQWIRLANATSRREGFSVLVDDERTPRNSLRVEDGVRISVERAALKRGQLLLSKVYVPKCT
jgi:hypothetical protein